MGHKNKNLKMQCGDKLQSIQRFGQKKHDAKADNSYKLYIYSYNTYKTYKAQAYQFCEYVKSVDPSCKSLSDAFAYVNDYLQSLIDAGYSAYSIKTAASALGKLFGCSTEEFIKTPCRCRDNVTRSRLGVTRDIHFNEELHSDFVEFCRSTGLRRAEISALRGDWLVCIDGHYFIDLRNTKATKGGRPRVVPVIGDVDNVIRLCSAAGSDKVFKSVFVHADIHSYRSDYCVRAYRSVCRDVSSLPRSELYYCQNDKAGVVYDRKAMKFASECLGHSRISIIASSYLR